MAYKCKRLNLNWSLESKEERTQFIQSYLKAIPFEPNESELDMMSKYILWGKSANGLNGRQEGLELETSHGTWDTKPTESLDALLESPTFTESMLRPPNGPIYTTPKFKFSRAEARASAPPDVLQTLETLWTSIDRLELLLSYYDLAHNRRTKPIRESLLSSFSSDVLTQIQSQSTHLNLYQYLNFRHELVELYKQQYTLRDFYSTPITQRTPSTPIELSNRYWDSEINISPIPLLYKSPLFPKLFRTDRFPVPSDFTNEELKSLTSILWGSQDPSIRQFDFTNPSHLAQLSKSYLSIKEYITSSEFNELYSSLDLLIQIYESYCALTSLKDSQKEILNMKQHQKTNEEIATYINQKYGHKYTFNYISTLYHKTILESIATTAKLHREVCENLMFSENFKKCIDCGSILLKDSNNFMRKTKVKDGFDCRCKLCAKELRNKRRK